MITIDILYELTNALFNRIIADLLQTSAILNGGAHPQPQNLHGALRPNCIRGIVTGKRLYTSTYAVSNRRIAHPPFFQ